MELCSPAREYRLTCLPDAPRPWAGAAWRLLRCRKDFGGPPPWNRGERRGGLHRLAQGPAEEGAWNSVHAQATSSDYVLMISLAVTWTLGHAERVEGRGCGPSLCSRRAGSSIRGSTCSTPSASPCLVAWASWGGRRAVSVMFVDYWAVCFAIWNFNDVAETFICRPLRVGLQHLHGGCCGSLWGRA